MVAVRVVSSPSNIRVAAVVVTGCDTPNTFTTSKGPLDGTAPHAVWSGLISEPQCPLKTSVICFWVWELPSGDVSVSIISELSNINRALCTQGEQSFHFPYSVWHIFLPACVN